MAARAFGKHRNRNAVHPRPPCRRTSANPDSPRYDGSNLASAARQSRLGPLLFDHRAARRVTSHTCGIDPGVATKTSSTRCRLEISRNVRTCAQSREQREGHPRSLSMPYLPTYSQFSGPIADRIATASRSTTATAAHRATKLGTRPRTRRGDGEASIRLRSMLQTSNQGFFLYSQCVDQPGGVHASHFIGARNGRLTFYPCCQRGNGAQSPRYLLKVLDRGTTARR
jgi:hypothetical protein